MTNHLEGLGLRGPSEVDVGVDDPVEREGVGLELLRRWLALATSLSSIGVTSWFR